MTTPSKLALSAAIAAAFALSACQQKTEEPAPVAKAEPAIETATPVMAEAPAPELGSGIEMSGFNKDVRIQDDFFEHANGKWVADTEMPSDKARWGAFDMLAEKSQEDVKALVEEVSASENVEAGSATQKIRDYYNAYMDASRPNELGIEAIRSELDQVAAIETHEDLFRAFATLGVYNVSSPLGAGVFSDFKDPNTNIVYIVETGITPVSYTHLTLPTITE